MREQERLGIMHTVSIRAIKFPRCHDKLVYLYPYVPTDIIRASIDESN
jgi:hypothetical protein